MVSIMEIKIVQKPHSDWSKKDLGQFKSAVRGIHDELKKNGGFVIEETLNEFFMVGEESPETFMKGYRALGERSSEEIAHLVMTVMVNAPNLISSLIWAKKYADVQEFLEHLKMNYSMAYGSTQFTKSSAS